jgi:putative holliday junction resolvase
MNKIHDYLGVDLGMSKSGIARGNSVAKIAEPVSAVSTADLLSSLKIMIEKNNSEAVVLGLPRNLDGKDTKQTEWTRKWATQAKTQLSVPIYWQDEALTTHGAQQKGGSNEDALAAAMILQDFLDTPESERVIA